jgi:16S rRNA (guanine966-N2)-methyltransferase
MKIRLVAGDLKGRILSLPQRDNGFRPTQGRIREAVANILMPVVRGAIVADLCAGSGACGFELLSRGAARVVFVEKDRFRCKRMEKHAELFDVSTCCAVLSADYHLFLERTTSRFDIVYLDPPYDMHVTSESEQLLQKILAPDGILVFERRSAKRRSSERIAPRFVGLTLAENRLYGMTELFFYRKTPSETDGISES